MIAIFRQDGTLRDTGRVVAANDYVNIADFCVRERCWLYQCTDDGAKMIPPSNLPLPERCVGVVASLFFERQMLQDFSMTAAGAMLMIRTLGLHFTGGDDFFFFYSRCIGTAKELAVVFQSYWKTEKRECVRHMPEIHTIDAFHAEALVATLCADMRRYPGFFREGCKNLALDVTSKCECPRTRLKLKSMVYS